MILKIIERTIREFNYSNYGLHELDGVNEPDALGYYNHEWPPDLAQAIADALHVERTAQ